MTFKQAKLICLLFLTHISLWGQNTAFHSQKTTLENSYHDKVVSTLSRLISRDNFIAIINIEFSNDATINKNIKAAETNEEIVNGYTPIPGLPTVPSQNNNTSRRKNINSKQNNYQVNKITINIELNEDIASETINENIKSLINKAIPEIKDCEDCIMIDTIQFLPTQKSTLEKKLEELQLKVSELQAENDLYEDERRKAELEKSEKNYEEIQKKLSDALEAEEKKYAQVQKKLSELEEKENERIKIEQEKRDAELLFLQEEKQKRTDQLIKAKEASEKKVERMMNSKIRSDSLIISEAMDMYKSVMKQKGGSDFDNEALLGMQIGNSGPGMMNAIIFLILILFIIILLFFTLNKKNKTIYLKPKTKKKSSKKEKNIETNDKDEAPTPQSLENKSVNKQDEDSIRSELKTLKQTAVSLTVGEKESATNLIKEWLDDNPNRETNSEE
ncbi:MAG: hypothetical protein VX820_02160 [Candidatus Neomarinimicrobiota bacterium]|nr:hypothetical protein [Candidatus Neomarinimicrobiota bacterium]